jgi:acetolactate synthase I/III small subunit
MEKSYTISIFTEDVIGILNRITIIFTRRYINIQSITASESEVKGVYRYTIVAKSTIEKINKVIGQIEKLVDVFKAFVMEEEDIVYQEIALYKINLSAFANPKAENVIRENNARILAVDSEFIVIEKTGHKNETQELFEKLKPFGILEFARSGRVAITKPMKQLSSYLKEIESKSLFSATYLND